LSSCIKEDLSDCPPSNQALQVIFTNAEGETPLIGDNDLQRLTLFIFDEKGNYLDLWIQDSPKLDSVYYPDIELSPGNYKFIVWSNILPNGNFYDVIGLDKSNSSPDVISPIIIEGASVDFLISNGRKQETLGEVFPVLAYGNKIADVQVADENRFIIPLRQNTNKVNLKVTGLSATDDYVFSIVDNNESYDFDDRIIENKAPFSYETNLIQNANDLTGSLFVLKLEKLRTIPLLKIYEKISDSEVREIFSHGLIELISWGNPSYDFDTNHNHTITIDFWAGGMSINGWDVIPNDGEIEP
jgi:hypothetical protein